MILINLCLQWILFGRCGEGKEKIEANHIGFLLYLLYLIKLMHKSILKLNYHVCLFQTYVVEMLLRYSN